jgi:cytochrome b
MTDRVLRPNAAPTGGRTRVWDGFVRVFHWGLVVAFVACYGSAKAGLQELHTLTGYGVLALVAGRVVWGFTGTPYARFTNFVFRPRAVAAYLGDIVKGHPRRFLGHNPAGGAMVIALLAGLVFVLGSGVAVLGVIDFDGPLVKILARVGDAQAYLLRDLHTTAVDVVLVLVGLHIMGVALASIQHRENLVAAMVTGYKSDIAGMQGTEERIPTALLRAGRNIDVDVAGG